MWVDGAAWSALDRDRKRRLIAEAFKAYKPTLKPGTIEHDWADIAVLDFSNDWMLAYGTDKGAELNPPNGKRRRAEISGGFGVPR